MSLVDEGSAVGAVKLWPPNSIEFFRKKKGMTLTELAQTIGTTYQTVQRLEKCTRKLDPKWAAKIGSALGVPAGDIAYSRSAEPYPWATRAIPVCGEVGAGLRIDMAESPRPA